MENNCKQKYIPKLNFIEDKCGGEYKSTDCVIHEEGVFTLNLPENSKLSDVIDFMASEINRLRVASEKSQEFEEKVRMKIDL